MLNKQSESEAAVQVKATGKGVQIVDLKRAGETPRASEAAGQAVKTGAAALPKGHKITARLTGLGCLDCAGKMETEIRRLPGVATASVDFIAQKLTLQMDLNPNAYAADLTQKVTDIIQGIEPGVQVNFTECIPQVFSANPAGNAKPAHVVEQVKNVDNADKADKVDNADKADKVDKTENVDHGQDHEHAHWDQLPLMQLVLGGALFALALALPLPAGLELALYFVSYGIIGGRVVFRALKGLARGQIFNEHFLMSVATIGAFIIGEYPEGVAVMLFYLVGEMFQNRAVDRSRKSISSLMDIKPDYANLKVGGDLQKVFPEMIRIGDLIVVKPGEKVPLDGKVLDGHSLADTAALTGESMPRELAPGSEILSGFINLNGVLTVEVTKNYGESTVAKILDLLENARSHKSPTEHFISKFARYYTPAVVFGALALALLPPLLLEGAAFADWTYRALVFLVVSCPCALVISIPLSFFGGLGGAAKRGILIKGSNYLEALNHVETVVFDKTGTLTQGGFKLTGLNAQNGFTQAELLEYAAYAESHSSHPIAVSIINAYNKLIDLKRIEKYTEIPGQGVKVRVDGQEIWAGNSRLMNSESIRYDEAETLGTVVHVAVNQKYAGNLVITDEVKPDAATAIRELKDLGVKKTVMLTGDLERVGAKLGRDLGIDAIYTELLPTDKVAKLEGLMHPPNSAPGISGKVVYVGDGINDAPVLARADIGIAMGGLGSAAAIEAADIVIMTDEPSKLATALRIARKTRQVAYQNIVFALGVKAVFLGLGAMGIASMWEAVFGDVGVALIAIFNAMRVMNTDGL